SNEGGQSGGVWGNKGLAPQSLPEDQRHHAQVAQGGNPDQGSAPPLVKTAEAPVDENSRQRQDLKSVQADEVSDTQIAAFRTPAGEGQTLAAIFNADAVSADKGRRAARLQV